MSRLGLLALCLPLGAAMSWALAELRAPDAPAEVRASIAALIALMLWALLDRLRAAQVETFTAICEGDARRCAELLARRRAGGVLTQADFVGTAALEVVCGEPTAAVHRIRTEGARFGPVAKLAELVLAHAELVTSDPSQHADVLARVLAMPPPRMTEARRYRALVVAHAGSSCADAGLVDAAAAALATERDARAREFGTWVRAWHALPLAPDERADAVRRAAALEGRHRATALAARVEARATALAHLERGAAYR